MITIRTTNKAGRRVLEFATAEAASFYIDALLKWQPATTVERVA